ncbi:MAG: hypothetical protein IT180_01510 [Acidobacteria bacterium]|nr:hypothetical protein [Acidobacteriota bacterium]
MTTAAARISTVGLTVLLFSPSLASAQNHCTGANPNDSVADDAALQACLDAGGTSLLSPGSPGYLLASGLRLAVNGTVLSSASAPTQARIVAMPGLNGVMISNRKGVALDNWEISWINWDGNKNNRTLYATICNDNYRPNGMIASVKGNNCVIKNNAFENAMCGSALEVSGSGYQVYTNSFFDLGFPEGQASGAQPFADAISTIQCVNSSVTSNYIENATDVGIVVGLDAATGCQVRFNTIRNTTAHGFAGIHIRGEFNQAGSLISDNVIESGYDKLAYGIFVGEGPWGWSGTFASAVGQIVYNTITGAVVNLAVDHVASGEIRYNTVYGAKGTYGLSCSWPAEYTTGATGSALLQPGSVYRTYSPGGCTPYADAPPSSRIESPATGFLYQEGASVTLYADASDPDSSPARVDFYAGSTLLGSDYSAPFSLTSTNAPPGIFTLTTVACDSSGFGPTSAPVVVTVNAAPLVSFTAPASGTVYPVGSTVTVSTSASDPDGTVARVDFYVNGGLLASDTAAPFSLTASGVPYGDYVVQAVAYDNRGGSKASSAIIVYVR